MEQNIYIIERPFRLFLCRAEKMWSESSKTTPRTRFTQRDFDERDTRLMGEAFRRLMEPLPADADLVASSVLAALTVTVYGVGTAVGAV